MTNTELLTYANRFAKALRDLGCSQAEITAFLAGARLCGHLNPSGCAWRLEHALTHNLALKAPQDNPLEAADYRTAPRKTPREI